MEAKAEDVNVHISVKSSSNSSSSTDELHALHNAHNETDDNISKSNADIVISEIHANGKNEIIIDDSQDKADEVEVAIEEDINAAIPTQQRYDAEEPTLIQYSQKGPFKSVQARTYIISFALLCFCILQEWYWDDIISDAKLMIDTCDAIGSDFCNDNKNLRKIRDGAFTIFFGIFAMFPGIILSVIAAAKGDDCKMGMRSLIANVIGTILCFCGYCVYVNGKPYGYTMNQTAYKANLAQLFAVGAIVCGHAIILSLDNALVGFLDGIKKRALLMSSGLFAVFGFIAFVAHCVMSNELSGEKARRSCIAIAVGFFFVSIASMMRIGIIYGTQNYKGADDVFSKFVCALMGIGGVILVCGYWALAASEHELYDEKGEEAGIIGDSIFFGIVVAVNTLDMALGKVVREVRSSI